MSKKKKIPQIVKDIRNHPKYQIDWSTQKLISYSQLSMYNTCPKKWAIQYKDKAKAFTSSIFTIFGSALHKSIQHYITKMYEINGVAADKENIIEIFGEALRAEYKSQYIKNNNQHFSSSEELREFYEDGIQILEFFKKKRNAYFSKKGWYLVGCEIPVESFPNKQLNHVIFQGHLDIVLYHENTNTFKIIDLKSSTRSWGDLQKKDKLKHMQLVLYKKYFSEKFNVPIDSIEIEFFILKRKLYENIEFRQSRIQTFIPPSGRLNVKKATETIDEFINGAFDFKGYKEKTYEATPSPFNCTFCPFLNTERCTQGIS